MIGNLEDFSKNMGHIGYLLQETKKYMSEALKPKIKLVRDFYSLLRVAIKGARTAGNLKPLVNDQIIPNIIWKMPHTDWKHWA
jgi:hypothetical protein